MGVSCAQLTPLYLEKLCRRALFYAKGTYVEEAVTPERLTSLIEELRWVTSLPEAVDGASELKVPMAVVEAK